MAKRERETSLGEIDEEWSFTMIGTAVDPRAFAEVPTDDRFKVDPPAASPMLVSDTMEITRSSGGTDVIATHDLTAVDIPQVERP